MKLCRRRAAESCLLSSLADAKRCSAIVCYPESQAEVGVASRDCHWERSEGENSGTQLGKIGWMPEPMKELYDDGADVRLGEREGMGGDRGG